MDIGVRSSGISAVAVGTGGALVALGSGNLTATESLLLIIAINETAQTFWNYYEG